MFSQNAELKFEVMESLPISQRPSGLTNEPAVRKSGNIASGSALKINICHLSRC